MENNLGIRKYLIATHGKLAGGVKSSLEIITGAMDNVFLIEAYVNENRPLEDDIKVILAQIDKNDELIVFSDILGGSVTNQLLQYAHQSNVHIVSGFNLPLVIEVVLADAGTPADELIANAIDNAKQQMVYVNKLLTMQSKDEEND